MRSMSSRRLARSSWRGGGSNFVVTPSTLLRPWQSGTHLFDSCGVSGGVRVYLSVMQYSGIITMEPGKRSGKPCIRGLRMTVADVLGYLAAGMTHDEILLDYPYLIEEDIRACLAFAADRERRLETMVA